MQFKSRICFQITARLFLLLIGFMLLAGFKFADRVSETALQNTRTYLPIVAQRTGSTQRWVNPYPGAPKCPDWVHQANQWHSLWNHQHGCHYDHTHNANPTVANGLFGPPGAMIGGQSLSYPWQTPNENQLKHEGYKYFSSYFCSKHQP